ncbi:MAG TPA: hypothetical protein VHG69_03845 [Thermoleophilaceae bacterium]|nr:hypothetical protein [Thermoleophilaceae bacterium]
MAADLRKCVVMGPINHGGDVEDLRMNGNLDKVRATGARWVKIWIRWDKAQLFPPSRVPMSSLDTAANDAPGYGAGGGFRYIRAIDEQVALARSAGLKVMLITWLFPRWANGTEGRPADWMRHDRGSATAPVANLKSFEQRIPIGQLGTGGYYGRWLSWLIDRYRRYGQSFALEIMNEPNLQMWPQQGPSPSADPYQQGPLVIDSYIAQMIDTARQLSSARGHPIRIGVGGMADAFGADSRTRTNFQTGVPRTLDRLAARGFPSTPSFIWTHHNYSDIERDLPSPTRAEMTVEMLRGRWRGRGGSTDPRVWLTEGGARLGTQQATDLARQAQLVKSSWDRMTTAPGIEMFPNYLMYENPYANSGLRYSLAAGGGPRPVCDAFTAFPSRV